MSTPIDPIDIEYCYKKLSVTHINAPYFPKSRILIKEALFVTITIFWIHDFWFHVTCNGSIITSNNRTISQIEIEICKCINSIFSLRTWCSYVCLDLLPSICHLWPERWWNYIFLFRFDHLIVGDDSVSIGRYHIRNQKSCITFLSFFYIFNI